MRPSKNISIWNVLLLDVLYSGTSSQVTATRSGELLPAHAAAGGRIDVVEQRGDARRVEVVREGLGVIGVARRRTSCSRWARRRSVVVALPVEQDCAPPVRANDVGWSSPRFESVPPPDRWAGRRRAARCTAA